MYRQSLGQGKGVEGEGKVVADHARWDLTRDHQQCARGEGAERVRRGCGTVLSVNATAQRSLSWHGRMARATLYIVSEADWIKSGASPQIVKFGVCSDRSDQCLCTHLCFSVEIQLQ